MVGDTGAGRAGVVDGRGGAGEAVRDDVLFDDDDDDDDDDGEEAR